MGNEFFRAIYQDERKIKITGYEFIGFDYLVEGDFDFFENLDDSVKDFIFIGISISSSKVLKNLTSENKTFEFIDCSFGTNIFEKFNGFEITFSKKCQFFGDKNKVTFIDCQNITINFENFKEDFGLGIVASNYIKIKSDCNVDLDVSISNSKKVQLNLTSTKKHKLNLAIFASQIQELSLRDLYLNDFRFYDSSFSKLFLLNIDSENKIYFELQSHLIELINIEDCKLESIEFIGLYNRDTSKYYPAIQILRIVETNNIRVSEVYISDLVFTGYRMSNIDFWDLKFRDIRFDSFSVERSFKLNSIDGSSVKSLKMYSALLNNLEINPSFFHELKDIEFLHSSLTGINLFNFVEIPDSVIINYPNMDFQQKIDFTRELTALMIQQNNNYLSTVYRALEQDFRLKSNKFRSKADKVILTLNSLSNSHGTRPEKAFSLIVLLIVFQFLVINLDLYFQSYLPYEAGFDFLSQNYSYFIDPLLFLSEVEADFKLFGSENMQVKFHPITKGFDFLFKIFYAYLLYQFIAAFRKFNK